MKTLSTYFTLWFGFGSLFRMPVAYPTNSIAIASTIHLNVHRPSVQTIYSVDTNNLPTGQDKVAQKKCQEVADLLNRSCK